MNVLEHLQQTVKGRLIYDCQCLLKSNAENVLNDIHLESTAQMEKLSFFYRSPSSFGIRDAASGDRCSDVSAGLDANFSAGGDANTSAGRDANISVDQLARTSPNRGRLSSADRRPNIGADRADNVSADVGESISTDRDFDATVADRTSPQSAAGNNRPFTPCAYEKFVQTERDSHLREARSRAMSRLAEETCRLDRLRADHGRRLQQLRSSQQLRHQQQLVRRQLDLQQSERLIRDQLSNTEKQQTLHTQEMKARIEAVAEQKRRAAAELRRRASIQESLLQQIIICQQQLQGHTTDVLHSLRECGDQETTSEFGESMKQLMSRMDTLTNSLEADSVTAQLVSETQQIVKEAEYLNTCAKSAADDARRLSSAPVTTPVVSLPTPVVTPSAAIGTTALDVVSPPVQHPADYCLLRSAFDDDLQRYQQLQVRLAEFQSHFKSLLTDPALKKFRFDCQKAVNTPLNAVGARSAVYLRDKLDRLRRLLLGESVTTSAGGRVAASAHPAGVHFCTDLLAKMFVRQGEDVVSGNAEAAFSLAAVMRALWIEFPVLVDLVLAHFYARCPYLLPMYPSLSASDSDQHYYRKCGYLYDGDTVETQENYLRRMCGLARLYAALLTSRAPRQSAAAPLHVSVDCVWRWVCSAAGLQPRPDITASVLSCVLDVAASQLIASYGRQLLKLVRLLHHRYLPEIQQVTPEGCRGPVLRLEDQLSGIIRNGYAGPPEGQLNLPTW